MKKIFGFFFLITLFIIYSCVGEKISLRLNMEQGTTYRSRITAKQKITQIIQDQKVDMDQTIIMEYTYAVIEVNEKGNMIVKITHDEIGYSMDGPMGKIEYKSWEDVSDTSSIAKGFDGLLGQSVTMEITPRGKIINISGADKIIDNMLKHFDLPADDKIKEQTEENLQNQYGNEAIKETVRRMFAIYPEKLVGVGDSWHAKFIFTKGYPMIINKTWKLKSIKGGKAYIDIYSKIEPNKETTLTQMGGVEVSYELSGEQRGCIVVDTLRGWIIESEANQEFEGKILASGSTFEGPLNIEWPISATGTIIIETIEE